MADDSSSQQIDLIIHYGTCGKNTKTLQLNAKITYGEFQTELKKLFMLSLDGWTVHHHNGGRLGAFEKNEELRRILKISDLSKPYHLDFILCSAEAINVTSEEECDLIVGRSNNFQKIRIKQGETCQVTIEKLAKLVAWVDYPKKIKIVDETIPIDDVSGGGYRMIIRKYKIPEKGKLIIKFNEDKKTVKHIETHTKENKKPVIIESYEKKEYREDDNERVSKKDKAIKYTGDLLKTGVGAISLAV